MPLYASISDLMIDLAWAQIRKSVDYNAECGNLWNAPLPKWRWRDAKRQPGSKAPHATPKGLRHGFGIKAVTSGVLLNALQQLLGHAQLATTSICADAMGSEKRNSSRQ